MQRNPDTVDGIARVSAAGRAHRRPAGRAGGDPLGGCPGAWTLRTTDWACCPDPDQLGPPDAALGLAPTQDSPIRAHPRRIAYYVCFGPQADPPCSDLERIAQEPAGDRGMLSKAKERGGLDHYQGPSISWRAWYAHITCHARYRLARRGKKASHKRGTSNSEPHMISFHANGDRAASSWHRDSTRPRRRACMELVPTRETSQYQAGSANTTSRRRTWSLSGCSTRAGVAGGWAHD